MERSESIKEISAALSKAQAAFPPIERTAHVGYSTKSGNKNYSYAPLADIIKACKKALGDNELCVMQGVETEGGRVTIETMITHSSGEWLSSSYTMAGSATDPQTMGSLITYGRRYGQTAMLNIAADEDDDAANVPAATNKPQPASTAVAHQPQPTSTATTQEHWCEEHNTEFFMRGKMKSHAHPVDGQMNWCYEHKKDKEMWNSEIVVAEIPGEFEENIESPPATTGEATATITGATSPIDLEWLKEQLDYLQENKVDGWSNQNIMGYLNSITKTKGKSISASVKSLTPEQADDFTMRVVKKVAEIKVIS